MNWLDWLLVVIIVLTAVKGLKAGFFAGAAGIAGLLGGIWAALKYHGPLADFLSSEWNWDKRILDFLSSHIYKNYQDNSFPGTEQQSEGILNTIISKGEFLEAGLENMQLMADSILNIMAFGLIVFITYIVAGSALRIASRIVAGTLFSPFDKLGGLLLGVVKGGIIAGVVLILLLTLQAPLSILSNHGEAGFLTLAIQKSTLSPLLLDLIQLLKLPLPVPKMDMV